MTPGSGRNIKSGAGDETRTRDIFLGNESGVCLAPSSQTTETDKTLCWTVESAHPARWVVLAGRLKYPPLDTMEVHTEVHTQVHREG